jgi:hypothetical protein
MEVRIGGIRHFTVADKLRIHPGGSARTAELIATLFSGQRFLPQKNQFSIPRLSEDRHAQWHTRDSLITVHFRPTLTDQENTNQCCYGDDRSCAHVMDVYVKALTLDTIRVQYGTHPVSFLSKIIPSESVPCHACRPVMGGWAAHARHRQCCRS